MIEIACFLVLILILLILIALVRAYTYGHGKSKDIIGRSESSLVIFISYPPNVQLVNMIEKQIAEFKSSRVSRSSRGSRNVKHFDQTKYKSFDQLTKDIAKAKVEYVFVSGTELREDTLPTVNPLCHIHIAPGVSDPDINTMLSQISSAKSTFNNPAEWNQYWDNLCHSKISHFVNSPTAIIQTLKDIIL